MLHLRQLLGLALHRKLTIKENDLPDEAFSIPRAEANVTTFSTSTLGILSSASLSTRVAWSFTSLTWRVALSRATLASLEEVSIGSIAVMRVASAAVAASHARITSASRAGMSTMLKTRAMETKHRRDERAWSKPEECRHDFPSFETNPN
jgi:hypothetical protein